jgi:hypothetical protein
VYQYPQFLLLVWDLCCAPCIPQTSTCNLQVL